MGVRRLFVVSAVLAALMMVWRWDHRPLRHPPGVLVAAAPEQRDASAGIIDREGFRLTPRAEFRLQARVLGRERYWLDRGAKLAPLDLALGWGPMSDQAVLDRIDVSQGGRWYHLRWSLPAPLPESAIMDHSANMHIVPAEAWIESLLAGARVGEVVELDGLLVDVEGAGGFRWATSLSRQDRGDGSCELFYVTFASLTRP